MRTCAYVESLSFEDNEVGEFFSHVPLVAHGHASLDRKLF
jgi:hypothetical protein